MNNNNANNLKKKKTHNFTHQYENSASVVQNSNNTISSNRSFKALDRDNLLPFQVSQDSNSLILKSHHSTENIDNNDNDIINKDSLTTRVDNTANNPS